MLLKIRVNLILFLSFSSIAFSQSVQREVFCTSGSYGNSVSVSLESNIGEFFIQTYAGSANIITQGFVQPDLSLVSFIDNDNSVHHTNVYPNPVKNILYVEMGEGEFKDLMVEIVDVLGRNFFSMQLNSLYGDNKWEINFESLSSGVYFVRVYSLENNMVDIFKVSKI